MKWTNKGHEFDEIGKVFEKNKDLLFLGNIEKSKKMKECLSFLGANIYIPEIEYDPKKKDLFGFNLKKHINSSGTSLDNKTILVFGYHDVFKKFLLKKGLKEELNFFLISIDNDNDFREYENNFFVKYLSIFAVYAYDKVYIPSNNIVTTTVCNLNCTECLNYNPYNKNKKNSDIDRLKTDVDTYFKYVDKVGIFHVTGGEPTLYPQLSEFLLYIINNYRDKIIDLVMPTNAIREIPDELIEVFKKGNMLIEIDNYLNVVPQHKNIFEKNFNKLKEYGIRIYGSIDKVSPPFFISSYPPSYDYSLLSDEENCKRFDYCGSVFSEIRNKKIYSCCYHGFAETAGIIEQDDDAVFNLDENLNKKEFIEFRMKYNNRGFTKFCTKCNGLPPLNIKALPTGEQTNGIISWDGSYKEYKYITVDEMINNK